MSDATLLLTFEAQKKSGWIAAFLNLIFPGAGYIYCGRWFLGIIAFLLVVAILVVSFGFAAIGLSIILVIDGFFCAGRYNKQLLKRVLAEEAEKQIKTNP